jgi:hypothetical protein
LTNDFTVTRIGLAPMNSSPTTYFGSALLSNGLGPYARQAVPANERFALNDRFR